MTEEIVGAQGLSKREAQVIAVDDSRDRARTLRSRAKCVGDDAYTDGTVSLNWRTLEKPAAKATSVIARCVVSMRIRAVWARWARAMAIGPAPISFCKTRSS